MLCQLEDEGDDWMGVGVASHDFDGVDRLRIYRVWLLYL